MRNATRRRDAILKRGASSCGMVHLKSSAECLVFFIAGGEQSFQGWDGTWVWASIQLVSCPQGTALERGSAGHSSPAGCSINDGRRGPLAMCNERASDGLRARSDDERRAMDRIWPRSGGEGSCGRGCACSRSEPCALRFVPLDEQTVPRRKDVTKPGPASCLCRPAWCVCPSACGVRGVCVFEPECECACASG